MLRFAFLPTTVWLLALGDLARPRSWSLICALSSWLASLFLCLLNCDAPLGGVAQCWPSWARMLPLGARYCGRCARAARAAAHPAAWLLIVAAVVITCALAGPARYCPWLLPCPASVLSWHASFLLVPRFAFLRATVWLLALGDTTRPRSRPLICVPSSWLASHLFCAELFNYCLSFSRSSTPPRYSASDGPPVPPDSTRADASALAPEAPAVAAHATQTPPVPVVTPDANLRGTSALLRLLIW
ncbi:hypothetical protein V6N12_019217 [Hibiscus sabdariffa]|uniref:Uncharacterized protein n=1 Tax=Hibiscus sabdariffa TaxID=183260 RepID=A0ABR2C6X5_9ROSI